MQRKVKRFTKDSYHKQERRISETEVLNEHRAAIYRMAVEGAEGLREYGKKH
jgi:hypothetical protein